MTSTVAAASRPPDADRLRGILLVLLAGTLWSTGAVLVRLVEHADARQIVLWRSTFIALFVGGVLLARYGYGRALPAALRAAGWNGLLGGACLGGAFVCFVEALTRTTVANTVFILAAQPVLAALLARLLLGEPIRRATLAAMALAAAGVGVMVAPGLASGAAAGSLLALGAVVGFALFAVALRRGRHGDATPCLLHAALLSGALCAAVLLARGGPAALAVGPRDLLACAAMGVVAMGCGLLAFTAGSRHLPAGELALLGLVEVALSPIWAWLFLGEVPAPLTFAGGALVLAAVTVQAAGGRGREGAR